MLVDGLPHHPQISPAFWITHIFQIILDDPDLMISLENIKFPIRAQPLNGMGASHGTTELGDPHRARDAGLPKKRRAL